MPTEYNINPDEKNVLLEKQLESISQIEENMMDNSKFSPEVRKNLNMKENSNLKKMTP